MSEDLLFVYGTLRRGLDHPMHHVLAKHAEWLGPARCSGRLVDLGDYPAAYPDPAHPGTIQGDLYRLRNAPAVLAELDHYEECTADFPLPHEYERRRIGVALPDGRMAQAWVYAYLGHASGVEVADGDYLAHLRRHDPPASNTETSRDP